MTSIERLNAAVTLALATGATSPTIDVRGLVGGGILVPAGVGYATLTFYAAVDDSDTLVPLYDGGSAVTMSVTAGRYYALPDQVFNCGLIQIRADVAGACRLLLKA